MSTICRVEKFFDYNYVWHVYCIMGLSTDYNVSKRTIIVILCNTQYFSLLYMLFLDFHWGSSIKGVRPKTSETQNILRSGPKYIAIHRGGGVGLQYGLPKDQKEFCGQINVFSGRPVDLWTPPPFRPDVFDRWTLIMIYRYPVILKGCGQRDPICLQT